ncbi:MULTISPECIES: asparaginase [unclassified Paenibacillus]|uniref:asparaginase n=1 Tax=unclassified Paenibacillus TaxID=185978 RepID=UPI0009A62BE1|nr:MULTISPECIES: asparaginase [unclassified Paenibacillus]SLK18083.1 asparaginase [Paenibacillus sp. RU5A]SOC75013.1 asparaginase [Paenibacillus sp. RU26A]SOC77119.1 asparaginase [Paenibacillus sp. RU5M]
MESALLIKEYRAGVMECAHYGHISITDENGNVVYSAGDPHFRAFTRSSAKPFQAIPGIRAGIAGHYGLTAQEIAIMSSSHRSEPMHIQVLEQIESKIGLGEECLICAPSYPLNEESRNQWLRSQGEKRRILHNCSGKHLGVLAYTQMKQADLGSYAEPEHPVQREILETMAYMAGIEQKEIKLGTDGCGFPVFSLPLSALSNAYLKLACPDLIEDPSTRSAVETITGAMNEYPLMVGGTQRVDSVLLEDSNIVAKGGFKGVFGFALKKERLGITFKVLDGSEEEWAYIAQSILEQIGYSNRKTIERLAEVYPPDIRNDAGKVVGRAESEFKLHSPEESV